MGQLRMGRRLLLATVCRRPLQVMATRELVAAVWPAFTSGDTISREAFLQPGDGLADTLVASLVSLAPTPPSATGPLLVGNLV